ncbi:MAG TPA: PAS domain-containing protein [Thermoleophilia bacterium]|nr:PAS domain-containing protein [Thermoleophilia bacterium]
MADVDATERSPEDEGGRLEFETLLFDLSSSFINLPPEQVDREIEDVQRRVCEVLAVDLSALWEVTAAGGAPLKLTHFYSSQEDLLPPMRGMSAQEYFPWLHREMLAGRSVAVSSLEELPDEAAVDRDNLRLFGVKSNLTVPLLVGGTSNIGALGLNTTRVERDWPDALVKRLQLVAQVFANALARKHADEALRESEERLSLAADAAEAGLWAFDYSTGVFWATGRARAIFGFSPDEVITPERLQASVHPDDWDLVREVIERPARADDPTHVEYRIWPAEGGVRWISSTGRPRFTPAGDLDRLMGVVVDITERKRAEEALLASEARLASGAELAGLAFYEVDFGAGAVYIDDRFRDLCGLPPDRERGLQPLEFWMDHLHPDDRRRVLDAREELHDGRLEQLFLEYRFVLPSQEQKWIQHIGRVAARDVDGHTVKSYGVLRDVTERKRAEQELHDLSRRLIRAQEEERALLARELHDDVSQRLAVLAIDVGRSELGAADRTQAATMQAIREGLMRLSEDVHSLAYQLHPSVLEELGLGEALRAECERRGRRSQLELSLDLGPLPGDLTKDAALCLFRVAQEALNNVARHAQASLATVALRQMDGGLLLAVSDDGVGFDAEHPGKGMRLGLASMRERVQLVNGTLDIETAPGRGATIVAWVPVQRGSE